MNERKKWTRLLIGFLDTRNASASSIVPFLGSRFPYHPNLSTTRLSEQNRINIQNS